MESDEQTGLEVAPSHDPELSPSLPPYSPGPWHGSPVSAIFGGTGYPDYTGAENSRPVQPYYVAEQNEKERKSICGLRPVTFWLVLVLVVLIIAGAVGGGVGGALASQNSTKNAQQTTGVIKQSTSMSQTTKISTAATATTFPSMSAAVPTPTVSPPSGCVETFTGGSFQLEPLLIDTTGDRDRSPLTCGSKNCEFDLADGILREKNSGWVLYISVDYRFAASTTPLNKGAIYAGGFSICANRSLMIGNDALWWVCPNSYIYTVNQNSRCFPELLNAVT